AGRAPDAGCAADAAGDVASPTESPIIGATRAAPRMLRHFLLVSNRRTFGLRTCVAVVADVDQSGEEDEGSSVAPPSPQLPASGSDGVTRDTGRTRKDS